jgi:hypothetical protein
MTDQLVSLRDDVNSMAGELLRAIGIPFEQTSELQRQVLAAFAFGMIYGLGRRKALPPPVVHALVIACLMDVFKYTDHQATAFSGTLISATSSGNANRTMNAIIHRGIDGHSQWEREDLIGMKGNIEAVFKNLGA